jgi:putative addiction module component (TIGR02574 family)
MGRDMDRILAEALTLEPESRAALASRLVASLGDEPAKTLSSAWREALERRGRELDEGGVTPVEAEDLLARLRALVA